MAMPSRDPLISDQELVYLSLLGQMEAFDELVRRFRGAVILVVERILCSREAAEDVAQEAFLIAFKALPQLGDPAKFAGWLCAIARNRARRVVAREGRSMAAEPSKMDRLILAHSEQLAPNPADELIRKDDEAQVRALLAGLAPDYQTALMLYYFEQWPVGRIAQFLSLPTTTVKWRLHHGRRLLYRQLAAELEDRSDE